MLPFKQTGVVLALLALVVGGIAASSPPKDPLKRNLKVLPKNISFDDLDKVMDGFKAALGVKCNFCHVPRKDSADKLDFASDEKPEKEIARHMYRMTKKINKKYFSFNKDSLGTVIPAISCITCHRGDPHPEKK